MAAAVTAVYIWLLTMQLVVVGVVFTQTVAAADNRQHSQLCRVEEYAEEHPVECGRLGDGPFSVTPPGPPAGGGGCNLICQIGGLLGLRGVPGIGGLL